MKPLIDILVDRFLACPLPETVCSDLCTTKPGPGRYGTALLNGQEAKVVLEHVLAPLDQAGFDVLTERLRQIDVEGWTPEHDDMHDAGGLAQAAACYALASCDPQGVPQHPSDLEIIWPWGSGAWKPDTRRRMLVKAAALLLAEIERLDRATAKNPQA